MNIPGSRRGDEWGATMLEYALMIALVAAALIAVVGTLKTAISNKYASVSASVSGAS